MKLTCICGAEIWPNDVDELKIYQKLSCPKGELIILISGVQEKMSKKYTCQMCHRIIFRSHSTKRHAICADVKEFQKVTIRGG